MEKSTRELCVHNGEVIVRPIRSDHEVKNQNPKISINIKPKWNFLVK